MSKVAVLIDVQNLYHSAKLFCKGKVSYKHLIAKIGEEREISFARAYAAHKDPKESKSFYSALEAIGISVYHKKVLVKHESGGSRVVPVHFDVEISTDALTLADEIDTVVLCTGNGNFTYLANALVDCGLKVEVWSFSESTSKELISSENWKFVQIPIECILGNTPEEITASLENAKNAQPVKQ